MAADGLRNYSLFDHSAAVNALNIGVGRPCVIGALIHTTNGADSLHWLITGSADAGRPASADYLISRDGTRHRICPRGYFPYHAGVSQLAYNGFVYRGDEVSRLLLGIELESRENELVTWPQIDSLAELVVSDPLAQGWRWPYYVRGHYDVARPLGRRSDPLGFDWGALAGRLYVRARASGVGGLD